MSDFCRQHGFYAPCPSCTGEEVIEEIPIMDGDSGIQLGVFTFNQGVYEDAMADIGDYREAVGGQAVAHTPALVVHAPAPVVRRFSASSPQAESPPLRSSGMPPARDHIPLPVNPGLYARVKTILHRHQ